MSADRLKIVAEIEDYVASIGTLLGFLDTLDNTAEQAAALEQVAGDFAVTAKSDIFLLRKVFEK